MVNKVWRKMLKVKRTVKTHFVIGTIVAMAVCSGVALAAPKVTCEISKKFFTKDASSYAEKAAVTGVVIYKKNGNVLESGETPYYTADGTRFKFVSYTGLSSAYKGWAYALNLAGQSDTDTKWY